MDQASKTSVTTGEPKADEHAVRVEVRSADEARAAAAADSEPAQGAAGDAPRPDQPTPAAESGGGASADEALARERDELRDRLLRAAAEFDNYRKRVERDRREQTEWAAADLLSALLPVVDDLERALGADPAADPAGFRAGVELIHRQLLDLLARRGVTPIEAVGADFDPRLHEAILHEASEAHRPGEVITELRRGYRLGDRLLRASMVKVAGA